MKAGFTCALCHRRDVPRAKRKRDLCEDCVPSLAARDLAWCTKGKHRAHQSDMHKDGFWCRACRNAFNRSVPSRAKRGAYAKEWRERNPDKVAAYNRRTDVQARRRAHKRAAYWRDPEAARARLRAYHATHRSQRYSAVKRWRHDHPDKSAAQLQRQRLRRKLRILQSWRGAL